MPNTYEPYAEARLPSGAVQAINAGPVESRFNSDTGDMYADPNVWPRLDHLKHNLKPNESEGKTSQRSKILRKVVQSLRIAFKKLKIGK